MTAFLAQGHMPFHRAVVRNYYDLSGDAPGWESHPSYSGEAATATAAAAAAAAAAANATPSICHLKCECGVDVVLFVRSTSSAPEGISASSASSAVGTHWIAAGLHFGGRVAFVTDSLHYPPHRPVTEAWLRAIARSAGVNDIRIEYVTPPDQVNGDDCGVAAASSLRFVIQCKWGAAHGGMHAAPDGGVSTIAQKFRDGLRSEAPVDRWPYAGERDLWLRMLQSHLMPVDPGYEGVLDGQSVRLRGMAEVSLSNGRYSPGDIGTTDPGGCERIPV
eukprot:TRINITY_DN2914_c0_g1_i1.p1 TRINITY_DN2914_c0_g1~~TRINITY_DN2914_c0_g1_i1.p1  ORF type:complete len:276 (-),score=30.22 TRINITY_DN2914_c0_g1_i1:574-1401(-)